MITLENVIHRFRLFAQNHNFIQSFSHGQEADLDLEKFQNYPIMHVVYRGLDIPNPKTGAEVVYRFSVVFLDKPTIEENKTEQALFALGDTQLYALDLLAELRNGHEIFVFDEDFEIESAAIQYLQEEYSNTLWGTILDLGLSVPYEFNACLNPIQPYVPPAPSFETIRVRNTDGVLFLTITSSVDQTLQDIEVEGADIVGSFPQPTRIVVEGADVESVDVNEVTGEMTITVDGEVCSPATYSNGGAFTKEIASGATYTAPEIVVTDVNGATRNVLPNIAVTCAWSAITVRSTDSVAIIGTINTYPSGGVALMGNQRVKQQDSATIDTVPYRDNIRIINADVASVFTEADETQITVVKETCPTPLGIAYKAVAPMSMLPLFTSVNDSRALFLSGWYDRTNPVYPVSYAEIDSAATQADVRAVAATGTSLTDPIIHTVLKHNNAFGNKLRFTDSLGNGSDATVGSDLYAHVNWVGHSWTGATPYYVIDHLTGDGYMVKYVVDSGDYNMTNTAVGKSWADWMTAIPLLNLAGFTDWKPLDCCSLRPHINKANIFETWAANFFITSRAPGEIAGQTDNRVLFVTGENANSLTFNALYDSGNASTILALNKATSGGFLQIIANVFPIRRHY
jgi:hypothetical protein